MPSGDGSEVERPRWQRRAHATERQHQAAAEGTARAGFPDFPFFTGPPKPQATPTQLSAPPLRAATAPPRLGSKLQAACTSSGAPPACLASPAPRRCPGRGRDRSCGRGREPRTPRPRPLQAGPGGVRRCLRPHTEPR
eukprot:130892-Chlamydomonas_euryale.AAC.8